MEEDRYLKAKRDASGTNEGAWKPGFGQLLGVVLALIFVVGAIILGVTTGIGLVFAIPLAAVGLIVGFISLGGITRTRRRNARCPHCGAPVSAPSHIQEYNCPSCNRRIEISGERVVPAK